MQTAIMQMKLPVVRTVTVNQQATGMSQQALLIVVLYVVVVIQQATGIRQQALFIVVLYVVVVIQQVSCIICC